MMQKKIQVWRGKKVGDRPLFYVVYRSREQSFRLRNLPSEGRQYGGFVPFFLNIRLFEWRVGRLLDMI